MPFRDLGRWRRTLIVVSIVFAVLEAADAFRIEETAFALVFAALTLAAAWWTSRGGVSGPIALSLLAALELAGIFFMYPTPASTFEWIDYGTFAVLSLAMIALAVATIVTEPRAPRA